MHIHVLILIKMFNVIFFLFLFFSYKVEMAIFNINYVQRAAVPKVTSYSFFFILHVVSWCFAFVRILIIISPRVLKNGHGYMVEMVIFNVQRAITPKVGKPELGFMCSASHLIVLYICVKFHEYIEWTQVHSRNGYFQYLLCSKDCNSKSRLTSYFFLFCMLSCSAIHL